MVCDVVVVTVGVDVVYGIGGYVGDNKCGLSEHFHLQEPTTNKKVLWRYIEPQTSQEKQNKPFTRYVSSIVEKSIKYTYKHEAQTTHSQTPSASHQAKSVACQLSKGRVK